MSIQNKLLLFCALFFSCITSVAAQSSSSTSFQIFDPVIQPGGFSTSTSFSLFGVTSELGIGTSSASTYDLFGGFLYFPFITTPAVSATAGDGQVSLSWTAADGVLGWSVGSYSIGQSASSGGPYTYTNVGDVLSSSRTGLTNSTPYYFIVRVIDEEGNTVATSTEVSGTPIAVSSGGGGGGGGGGGESISSSATGVILSGRAYPLSRVSILKDGQLTATTIAGPDSLFRVRVSGLSSSSYTFSAYSEDESGVRSNLFTFPIFITKNVITEVSGIFIAPTISLNKSEVRKGDTINIFGQSVPSAEIVVSINSEPEYFVRNTSDSSGIYLMTFDSSLLEFGNHTAKSKASIQGEISSFSNTAGFIVGNRNVSFNQDNCPKKADLNGDCRVNLVDFSIAAFWYKKSLSETFTALEIERLNSDGKVDLIDFSIMAYHWTG